MRYLLDTNTSIALMRNMGNVVARMAAVLPGDCAISTITSYELFVGAEKCLSPSKERMKVELLQKTVIELPFDLNSAREAGRIRALLESNGQMIGPYDILLAGHTLSTGLTLVTANVSEFQRVPALSMENWE